MSQEEAIPEHVLDTARRRLEEFVLRARRIQAHSANRDVEKLVKLSAVTIKVSLDVDPNTGKIVRQSASQELPPEEEIESLAARVRPLLLSDLDYLSMVNSLRP